MDGGWVATGLEVAKLHLRVAVMTKAMHPYNDLCHSGRPQRAVSESN